MLIDLFITKQISLLNFKTDEISFIPNYSLCEYFSVKTTLNAKFDNAN